MQQTHIDRIIAQTVHGIEGGLLKPGKRLLSIRRAAQELGVSKNTVAEAYDRLTAQGWVESRPGSGYYVRDIRRPARPAAPDYVAEAIDVVSLLREQLNQSYAVRVGDGRPPAAWMEGSELGRHLRAMGARSADTVEHGYGNPYGYAPLRERIALLLGERSIPVNLDQVLLTQGANHALDLVVRHMVKPGDDVLVDSPGYYPLFGKLKLAQANLVGVRRTPQGPDLEDFAAKAASGHAKLFFTQSLAHNPTGSSLSLATAHKLLQIAAQHGVRIVEDDPFADVLANSSPRLAALDGLDHVIYIGSMSKTLSASVRVGYIAAEAALVGALTDLKMVTMISTSDYVERGIHQLFVEGHYRRHLQRLRARMEAARARTIADLERIGAPLFDAHTEGYYLWVDFPESRDERQLVQDAARKGIFLAPGSVFYPARDSGPPAVRINIAHADDARFLNFMRDSLR